MHIKFHTTALKCLKAFTLEGFEPTISNSKIEVTFISCRWPDNQVPPVRQIRAENRALWNKNGLYL
jgi:hypothetical protein